jgi:hypothetical protein
MNVEGFWEIIAASDTPEDLVGRLAALSEPDLADFEVHHAKAYADAYDWGLWGAAYVIGGGCSDDSFDYFRGYLISRGRAVFDTGLSDPDSLADVELDDGEEWEDWMSPTMSVVEARTGEYGYVARERHPSAPAEPTGETWDEDDLPARFPRLSAKHSW